MDIITAWSIGILGSLHCIGMCGPIALSIPLRGHKWLSMLIYNSGRIVTYSFLGCLFGLVGKAIVITGFQQTLSVSAGIIIILTVFFSFSGQKFIPWPPFYQRFITQIRNQFAHLFQEKTYRSLFLIGIFNGFLPCGLLYLAIIGSLATGDPFSGSLFMMFFGLGTLPAMMFAGILRTLIDAPLKAKINKILPILTLVLGCLLIIRGMNLGIPYLSPQIIPEEPAITQCH